MELLTLKIHKIQIITFIAAKFQQTHPFSFTLNFTNITIKLYEAAARKPYKNVIY